MNDRVPRVGAPLAVLGILVAVVAIGPDLGLHIAGADPVPADRLIEVIDGLPARSEMVVGFDPDLGTYPELRPTVRTLFAHLLGRGARLRFVSMTPEGRALAVAEMARLDRLGAPPGSVMDIGFLPGAEAALVTLAAAVDGDQPPTAPAGLAALAGTDLAVVIGGNDLGPRSWVEQVAPRTTGLPIVAVTPTVLMPEVEPYRVSGQLAALLTTPGHGAAFRDRVPIGSLPQVAERAGPPAAAVAVGLLMAAAWLLVALLASGPVRRLLRHSERP